MSRALAVAIASMLAWAPAAQASSVSLLYSGSTGGISRTSATFEEIEPFYDERFASEVSGGGMVALPVMRQGPAMLFDPANHATVASLDHELATGELHAAGPRVRQQGLSSDRAFFTSMAEPGGRWALGWMVARNQEQDDCPDERLGDCWLQPLANAKGERRLLFQSGGAPIAANGPERWESNIGMLLTVKRGHREEQLVGFARMVPAADRRVPLMRKLRARDAAHTLSVDLGNALSRKDGSRLHLWHWTAKQALDAELDVLKDLGHVAIVPASNELSHPLADLRRLEAISPLLAANLDSAANAGPTIRRSLVREVDGLRIGLVGVTDDRTLTEDGLVGKGTAWQVRDPLEAARAAVADLVDQHLDAIVVLTNVTDERLAEFHRIDHCTLVVAAPYDQARTRVQDEDVTLAAAARVRRHAPALMVGFTRNQVGLTRLDFDGPRSLAHLHHHLEQLHDGLPQDAAIAARIRELDLSDNVAFDEPLLPDLRRVLPSAKNVDNSGYNAERFGRLAGSLARRGLGAEVALLMRPNLSSNLIGDVPRSFVEDWLPGSEHLVLVTLTGGELQKLAALSAKHEDLLAFAGFEPTKALINGRALQPEARYRVVTTDALARNRWLAEVFADHPLDDRRQDLRGYVMAALMRTRDADHGMTDAFVDHVRVGLADTGEPLEPLLSFAAEDVSFSLANTGVTNATPFSQVRNTAINLPANTAWGGKGKFRAVYDTPDTAWENSANLGYNKIVLQAGDQSVTNVTQDAVDLTSEFRLKFITLAAANDAISLVPYVNGGYETQFEPTVDQATGLRNPLERVATGSLGVLLKPKWLLDELRLAALARRDLAESRSGFEPGVQLAAKVERTLPGSRPLTLALGADLRDYFLTAEDTPADIGLLGDFTATLKVPIWEKLSLDLGVEALVFNGKVPSTAALGTVLSPTIGLGYTATWKPQYGQLF